MFKLTDLFTVRRVVHYGGGTVLVLIASLMLLLGSPRGRAWVDGILGTPEATDPAPTTPTAPSVRLIALMYAGGLVLLVTGGRSDAEKRGYNF